MTAEPRHSPVEHRINPSSSSHHLKITYIASLHPSTVTKQYLNTQLAACFSEFLCARADPNTASSLHLHQI